MSVWDVFFAAHVAMPYLVSLMTALVTLGFMQVAFYANGVVKYLTLGFLLLYLTVFLRTIYWDVLPRWIPPEIWAAWRDMTRGVAINIVFHILVTLACYFSLKAVYRAIPEAERVQFSIFTAPFYRFLRARKLAQGLQDVPRERKSPGRAGGDRRD